MKKILFIFAIGVLVVVGFILIKPFLKTNTEIVKTETPSALKYAGKKIIFVDSYQTGLPWSDAINEGIHSVLDKSGAELITIYMDTKNNPGDEFASRAGEKVKNTIDSTKPQLQSSVSWRRLGHACTIITSLYYLIESTYTSTNQ